MTTVLVHLASGVGNIILATPLLVVLSRNGLCVDVLVDGDYPDTAELLAGWSAVRHVFNGAAGERATGDHDAVIPAIPPFYWPRYRARYARERRCVQRPSDALFYEDEQRYYLEFARKWGCETEPQPSYFLPIRADETRGVTASTLVIAPGCKTGEMAAKRWPYFAQLAASFHDVAVVGSSADLRTREGKQFSFPAHARSFVDRLTLRQTAQVMAAAGAVVANDSGLAHIAGAVGVPTVVIFGPTPDRSLGSLPPNVEVVRAGLRCEPCWFGHRFYACDGRIDCLTEVGVESVAHAICRSMGNPAS
jgi:ADP-heptose:LPS heptosyltransferase